jgi:hypothetical protein
LSLCLNDAQTLENQNIQMIHSQWRIEAVAGELYYLMIQHLPREWDNDFAEDASLQ